MTTLRALLVNVSPLRHVFLCLLGLVLLLAGSVPLQAQESQWSFVFTPQLWMTNIPYNGFSALGSPRAIVPDQGNALTFVLPQDDAFRPGDTDPSSVRRTVWFVDVWGRSSIYFL